MSLFRKRLEEIKRRKANLENGGVNAIPFPFPNLTNYVPGIMKGTQYGVTGDTGASKSKFVRSAFVQTPFNFYYENKDRMDIDVEIFIFCIEDNEGTTMDNLMVSALAKLKGIRISPLVLQSYFSNNRLSDHILRELESLDEYFELLESKVHIIDSVRNPTGMLKTVKAKLLNPYNGNYIDEHANIVPVAALNSENYKDRKLTYKPVNDNKITIVITDNLQNVKPEERHNNNKWATFDDYCRGYMREKLCNFFGTCNCIIQQQEKGSGKAQFTNTGNQVVEKLFPSIAGLAEYKNSADSLHCLFGIFNPSKHRIEQFQAGSNNWYDITQLGDYYRYLSVLKSNFAETINVSLFADPFAETFTELPNGNDREAMQKVYDHITNLENKKIINPILFN